jgi:hypothetical protein
VITPLVGLLLVSAVLLTGQPATGQIGGKVSSPEKTAGVERVEGVEATITATGLVQRDSHSARSSESGSYLLAKLKPGAYELVTEAAGFHTEKQNVYVVAGAQIQVNVRLRRSSPPLRR